MTKDRAHRAVRRYFVTHKRRDGRGRQPRVEPSARSKKSGAARAHKQAAAVEIAWDGIRRFATDAEVRRAAQAARKFGKRDIWAIRPTRT